MVLILNRIVIQSFAWIILATFLGTIMYLFWKVVEKFVEKAGFTSLGIDNFEKEEKKKSNEKYKLIEIKE